MPENKPPSDPSDEPGSPVESSGDTVGGKAPESQASLKRLGDFDLRKEIGRGGMGIVYEAHQISLNRTVALKLLPPGLGLTEDSIKRFRREAQTAAKLHHTNIVPVYAIGEEEGSYYYAMELVEGQSLGEIMIQLRKGEMNALMEATVDQQSGQLPSRAPEPGKTDDSSSSISSVSSQLSESSAGSRKWFDTVATLLSDVADALEYAHDQGVIHRDIKPANLMLSRDGRLCITDFGLARVAQEPGMTMSGSFLGTPAYMSPEQIAAGRIKVDHRTDVYSLGAVLYETLTFERPFPGESREEILAGIMARDPRGPRRINPRIPMDLETICLKALEKDPNRRYQTAGEMAHDLRQFLSRGLITARRAGVARRTVKFVRRHPTSVTAAVAAVVLIVGIGGAVQFFSGQKASESALRAVSEAKYHLSQGEYSRGLEAANEALEIAPDLANARLVRARLLINLDRDSEAVEEAEEILAGNPDDWSAHLIMAMAARRGNQSTISAELHLAAVEKHAPETADAYYGRSLMTVSASEAVELLTTALELDPAHAQALKERGYRHEDLKNYPAALADAERLTAIRPRSAAGRRMVAWLSRMQHDLDQALVECDKAIKLDPDDAINYRERSFVYRDLGQPDKRLADLDKALELDPDYPPTILERGRTYRDAGRFEEAEQAARQVMEAHPGESGPWGLLYWTLRDQGRMAELDTFVVEVREFIKTWKDKEARGRFYSLMSREMAQAGVFAQALADADSAIALLPDRWWVYSARADVNKLMQNRVGMEADCRKCAEMEVTEPEQLRNRAFTLRNVCNRPDLALRDFNRLVEIAPWWANAHKVRGDYYRGDNQHELAIQDYSKAIELAPKWALLYNNRGDVYQYNLEDFENALADYDRFLEVGSDAAYLRVNRSQAYLRLGKIDEAFAELDRIGELQPQSARADQERSDAFYLLGRLEESLQAIERGLEKEPGDFYLHIWRAKVLLSLGRSCDEAMADMERARSLTTQLSFTMKWWLSWHEVTYVANLCPEQMNVEEALQMAQEIQQRDPNSSSANGVCGLALYRAGRPAEAVQMLERAIELSAQPAATNVFSLSMAYEANGQPGMARETLQRGLQRMHETYPEAALIKLMRDEAAKKVGMEL